MLRNVKPNTSVHIEWTRKCCIENAPVSIEYTLTLALVAEVRCYKEHAMLVFSLKLWETEYSSKDKILVTLVTLAECPQESSCDGSVVH